MKRIVTVIVVWTAFCLIGITGLNITTSAAAKDELIESAYSMKEQEVQKLSKSHTGKANKKKSKNTTKKYASYKKSTVLSSLQDVTLYELKSEIDDIYVKSNMVDTANDLIGITETDIDDSIDMTENENTTTDKTADRGNTDKESKAPDTSSSSSKNKKTSKTQYKTKKESNKKNSYTELELRYMTCIIYCEARGECYAGQKAVGIVVMNRKRSDLFPNGIKKVIYQKGQFTPASNGGLNKALSLYDKYKEDGKFKGEMPSCLKAAKEALEGSTTVNVDGKEKDMKEYLYFSRYIRNAKYTLGHHQFK